MLEGRTELVELALLPKFISPGDKTFPSDMRRANVGGRQKKKEENYAARLLMLVLFFFSFLLDGMDGRTAGELSRF